MSKTHSRASQITFFKFPGITVSVSRHFAYLKKINPKTIITCIPKTFRFPNWVQASKSVQSSSSEQGSINCP